MTFMGEGIKNNIIISQTMERVNGRTCSGTLAPAARLSIQLLRLNDKHYLDCFLRRVNESRKFSEKRVNEDEVAIGRSWACSPRDISIITDNSIADIVW